MPTTAGVEVIQPIMLQPLWVTIIVQIVTMILAAGVSYGMTKAKLSSNEKEILACQVKIAEIEKDFTIWQRQRNDTVVTTDDCHRLQAFCKESICQKLDVMGRQLEDHTKTANVNWKILALTIGRFCEKLDVDAPDFK